MAFDYWHSWRLKTFGTSQCHGICGALCMEWSVALGSIIYIHRSYPHNMCIDSQWTISHTYIYIYKYIYIWAMSNLENPRFTERTSTNLGRSHRLPHVCTIMIYGKLGGYRLQETATVHLYIYIIHRNQRPIWLPLMWILEKYNDITLKRGITNLGRSHRLPCVFTNFHQFP